MTPEQFRDRMKQISDECGWDAERAHGDMDDLMCDVLSELGYQEGVAIFYAQNKLY